MGSSLSKEIRQYAQLAWERMLHHRFVIDIESRRLPAAVFRRYLVYEHALVELQFSIFAYALARAPGLSQRRTFVSVLAALVEDQIAFFEQAFRHFNVDPGSELERCQPAGFLMFRNGMYRFAASGSYFEIMAATLTRHERLSRVLV